MRVWGGGGQWSLALRRLNLEESPEGNPCHHCHEIERRASLWPSHSPWGPNPLTAQSPPRWAPMWPIPRSFRSCSWDTCHRYQPAGVSSLWALRPCLISTKLAFHGQPLNREGSSSPAYNFLRERMNPRFLDTPRNSVRWWCGKKNNSHPP